ncbi:hypothetical protein JCM5353_002181 [Sporobolomyces roseus]
MSFSKLPPELKSYVLKLVAAGDSQYEYRTSKIRRGPSPTSISPPTSEKITQGWGNSMESLSLVNWELRRLALPYVFETLFVPKIDSDIFKFEIYGLAISCAISHLSFDERPTESPELLSHLFLFVCPSLPCLRKITGLRTAHIQLLLSGRDLVGPVKETPRLPLPRIIGLRNAFLRLAARITHWDIEIDIDNLGAIVAANPSGILSLRISTIVYRYTPYTDLLKVISPCNKLAILSLSQDDRIEEEEEEDDNEELQPLVDDAAFSLRLGFLHSLQSLSIKHTWGGESTSCLEFASIFPFLRHLKLSKDYVCSDQPEAPLSTSFPLYPLPQLRHLEILSSSPWIEAERIYHHLQMPLLETLTLGIQTNADSRMALYVCKCAGALLPSLRHLHLNSLYDGPPQFVTDQIRLGLPIPVKCSWTAGFAESDRQAYRTHPIQDFAMMKERDAAGGGEFREKDAEFERVVNETIYEAGEEMGEWVMGKFKGMRKQGDVAGTKELIRILKPVGEWRKWLED